MMATPCSERAPSRDSRASFKVSTCALPLGSHGCLDQSQGAGVERSEPQAVQASMTADRSIPDFWHHVPSDDAWKDVTLFSMERLNHRPAADLPSLLARRRDHDAGGDRGAIRCADGHAAPHNPADAAMRGVRPAGRVFLSTQPDDQAARVIGVMRLSFERSLRHPASQERHAKRTSQTTAERDPAEVSRSMPQPKARLLGTA
jgi:hypothetical protein